MVFWLHNLRIFLQGVALQASSPGLVASGQRDFTRLIAPEWQIEAFLNWLALIKIGVSALPLMVYVMSDSCQARQVARSVDGDAVRTEVIQAQATEPVFEPVLRIHMLCIH